MNSPVWERSFGLRTLVSQMQLVPPWRRVSLYVLRSACYYEHCVTVAGEIDTIELLEGRNIRDIIEGLKAQALEKAIKAGADPSPLFRSP